MKRVAIIGLLVIIVIVVVVAYFGRNKKSSISPHFGPTPTPIPVTYNKQSFSDPIQHYTIQYPQNWVNHQNDSPQDLTKKFTFAENNKTYLFIISPPVGNTVPDMAILRADKVEESN